MIEFDPKSPEPRAKLEELCAEVFTDKFVNKLIKLNKDRLKDEDMPIEALIEEAKYE